MFLLDECTGLPLPRSKTPPFYKFLSAFMLIGPTPVGKLELFPPSEVVHGRPRPPWSPAAVVRESGARTRTVSVKTALKPSPGRQGWVQAFREVVSPGLRATRAAERSGGLARGFEHRLCGQRATRGQIRD